MFKISLRWGFAALLKQVEIVFYLFGIQLGGQALKVQGHRRNMAAVIVKSAGCTAQDADVTLKAIKQIIKTFYLPAGPIQKLVPP